MCNEDILKSPLTVFVAVLDFLSLRHFGIATGNIGFPGVSYEGRQQHVTKDD